MVQINPDIGHTWGGFLAVVVEPRSDGFHGYLVSPRIFTACRFNGKAYVNVRYEDCEYVGRLEWVEKESEGDSKTIC